MGTQFARGRRIRGPVPPWTTSWGYVPTGTVTDDWSTKWDITAVEDPVFVGGLARINKHPLFDTTVFPVNANDLLILHATTQGSTCDPTPSFGSSAFQMINSSGNPFGRSAKGSRIAAGGGVEDSIVVNTGSNAFSRSVAGLAIFRHAQIIEQAHVSNYPPSAYVTSTPVPVLTGFQEGDICLVMALSVHGVVSGSVSFPNRVTQGYTAPFPNTQANEGKHAVAGAYKIMGPGETTNPDLTAAFSGSIGPWDIVVYKIRGA